jgi:acrylyl-CoA reductase (NADPH)
MLAWLTRTVKPWRNIVSIGLAGGAKLTTTVMTFILRGIGLLGVSSANCPLAWRAPLWRRLGTDLKLRHLDAIVSDTVTLQQLPDVFEQMLACKTRGRVEASHSSSVVPERP